MLQRILLLSVLLLAGCEGLSTPLDVWILPSGYQVGNIRSTLATPVVDEVVRLKPKKVLMSFCRTTPQAKTMQFVDELRARLQTDLQGALVENCPGG